MLRAVRDTEQHGNKVSRPLALELSVFDPELRPKGGRRDDISFVWFLERRNQTKLPSAVGGKCLSALGLGSLKLNGKSVLVK
jgi:hypothetical protein